MTARTKLAAATTVLFASATAFSACGTKGIQISTKSPYYAGAVLFRDHCAGCHTLNTVGSEGSATNIKDRLKTNGPNFNVRKEGVNQILYAIRNGGFSGAIMPENIVVGNQADQIAQFLAKYSGLQAIQTVNVNIPATPGSSAAGTP